MTEFTYQSTSAKEVEAGLLILPVYEGSQPGPGVKEAGLEGAFAAAKLSGKKGETLLVPKRPGYACAADAVLLGGTGHRAALAPVVWRRAAGRVAPTARRFGAVATSLAQAARGRHTMEAVQAVAEGLALGAYRFDRYRSKVPDNGTLTRVEVLGTPKWDTKAARAALRRAEVISEAVCWARDLVNTPAGDLPPMQIAAAAQEMAREVGLTCKVWTTTQLEKGGFGGILGVGKGSVHPPCMIELTYQGAGAKTQPLAITGKGITFDSGGLSIKPSDAMETMKDDMGGAASILATMRVLAQLKPKVNVIAAIPCSENMPSGSAQKPGDVIRHYGGKTSEVLNTDAEGRLVLADSLAYLVEKRPALVIDTATLTGACMVALGTDISGVFGNDDSLTREVIAAARAVGEPAWHMPLHTDYRTIIDSNLADVKNLGKRYGGAITAALFLSEFVDDVPWVHMDIAGPAFSESGTDIGPKGGTGAPVRTLVKFLTDRASR